MVYDLASQIRKRGDEAACVSLSDEKKVIHGLDELVHFYKVHLIHIIVY